jgi:hypothetical protein
MFHLKSRTASPAGPAALLIGLAAAATVLAACGGGAGATGSPTTGAATSPSAPTGGPGAGGGGQAGGRFPGASGLVAEVDGKTLQVQSATSQTAVTWSGTTKFTSEVKASKSQVKQGVCVVVRSPASTQSGTPPTDQTAVTAQSVAISQPVNGTCEAGFGRGGGAGRGFPNGGTPPTGAPTGGPTGGQRTGGPNGARGFGGFGGAFGTVTGVSATGFTVESTVFARPSGTASGSPTSSATPQKRIVTVTTTAATTYTTTAAATASAAKVGTCVTAMGASDATGTIAATSIAVRPAENGTCNQGFGRPAGQGTATTRG